MKNNQYIQALDQYGTNVLLNNSSPDKEKPLDTLSDWVCREFDFIPAALIYTMYAEQRHQLLLLSGSVRNDRFAFWPTVSGMLLHPRDPHFESRIRRHPGIVAQFGFLVYDTPEFGILLAMDIRGFLLYGYQFAYLERSIRRSI